MGEFIDARNAITVDSWSDDRLIHATQTQRGGLVFNLHPDVRREYTDDGLAEQIEECFLDVTHRFRVEVRSLLELRRGKITARHPGSEGHKRSQSHREQMHDFKAEAASPRGIVRTVLYGDGDISVKMIGNPLRRVDITHDVLVSELNASIMAACQSYNRHSRRLLREITSN